MKAKFAFFLGVVGAALCASSAQADQAAFDLSGSGISGSILLTYIANPNTGTIGTSPNAHDPVGSWVITNASGTFSDANVPNLTDIAILGVAPSNPGSPTSDNLLAPHSFGFYPVANGVPGPDGTAPGFSYDDLFYPNGSPQTATSYPFSGGVLDIYGLIFTLANGDAVNLWSNGNVPGAGLNYGVGVTNGTDVLDYQSPVSLTAVPEPATWAMMLVGFAAAGFTLRRRKRALNLALA